MGSIGGAEVLLILVLALLLLGPRKLPEVGRTLARTLSEFRKATHEFKANLEREVDLERAAGPVEPPTPAVPRGDQTLPISTDGGATGER